MRFVIRVCLAVSAGLIPTGGAGADDRPAPRHLDADEFREGLRQRGLIELLEFHLNESPSGDPVEADLLRRVVMLAAYADASRSRQERDAALLGADDVLRRLIAAHPNDQRALQWRLDLGRSLLYQQGERYFAPILYRGGAAADRQALGRIMAEAVKTFDALLALMVVEFERLDRLTLGEYERLERRGYIEQIEQLEPQAVYMRRWALFYRALARDKTDLRRLEELRTIVADLRDKTDLLTTPHDVSHYQAQALLLSGMASRRLGDHPRALKELRLAAETVDQLGDPGEQRALHWVTTLARLERARTLGEAGRHKRAAQAVDDFRAWVASTSPDSFGLKLVAAFLEGWVSNTQARRAAAAGNAALAQRLSDQALAPLKALAGQSDAYRDAVYADLYATLEPGVDPATLRPFARCALIAGLLAEAEAPAANGDGPAARRELLDRAIVAAELTLAEASKIEDELRAEVIYNLGVAYHRRGRRLESARVFVDVASRFPRFRWGESAATLAVQTAAELHRDPTLRTRDEIRDLYLHALELLTERYPTSSAAAYWKFFYAQILEELGRFDQAHRQYARVSPQHEHYVQARFSRARCLTQAAQQLAETGTAEPAEITRQALAAVAAAKQFVANATAGKLQAADSAALDRLVARALIAQAEVSVLPGVGRFAQALDMLEGFEQRHPHAPDLIGRVLRVRIIAYEGLGRLDKAEQEIPRYIESDPQRAVGTLQTLLDAKRTEIERLRDRGRLREAKQKARSALLLAEQIHAWAVGEQAGLSDHDRTAVTLQLAEACLAANDLQRAHDFFQGLCDEAQNAAAGAPTARALFGLAETLWGLGRHAEALPHYSRLYQQTEKSTAMWWRALLGDLRCRTELGHDPAGVIRVIEQHRYLYKGKLGDQRLQAQFEALLERNRGRLETD